MIRRAYPNAVWDDLVDRAYGAWARLEEAAGEQLLIPTGGVFARPRGAADALRGPGCEVLDAARRRARCSPRSGSARTSRACTTRRPASCSPTARVAAQQRLAREVGRAAARGRAARRLGAGRGGRRRGDRSRGRIAADRLVVCAGAWIPGLLPGLGPASSASCGS